MFSHLVYKQALCLFCLLTLGLLFSPSLEAQRPKLAPLTQPDLDAYIYVLPRLPLADNDSDRLQLLTETQIGRERMAYVASKVAIAQALVSGLLSPGQLDDENVPLALRPSAEELKLINRNLHSLVMAQQAAREAKRPGLPLGAPPVQP